jgi:hypothetical protein
MPAQLIETLIEAEQLLSGGVVWNDWLSSALAQLFAEAVAIVGHVAEQTLWRLYSPDQTLSNWVVVRFTTGQQDGDQAPLSICECMYLRVAPAA